MEIQDQGLFVRTAQLTNEDAGNKRPYELRHI
jgi:hypothetical protein